jgi:hypothetical protein
MGTIKDTRASLGRIRGYAHKMRDLLSRHEVHSIDDLKRVAKGSET